MNGVANYAARLSADQNISSDTPYLVRIRLPQRRSIVNTARIEIPGRMSVHHVETRSTVGVYWT